ncbi:ABC transporter ATP-binding protein [Williamwhitmania taraxaci]|uniref:ABC-type multidrug transport system, ATPase component n=1 Tax=Williamwhitmania taraxaci TaxID=1640674 RepID=A0A1G6H5K3_9BACT|nr:ABC transporter ATP-binding protein [Williamwhitmania taraxaci]SDB89215.1 ABC-type multidrug transport system, ATPase component [Williamwhitmania taraxaci]
MQIEIKQLSKVYPNGNKALDNVNLSISSGMFGLLGPNGAGKSTLMRILVTLMDPTEGTVFVDGLDVSKHRKEMRGMLGYLPQDFRFFSNLTTYEFLDFAARLSGMNRSKPRAIAVNGMLETVGLFDARDRKANKLSGGMKRRLGIAQALINDPRIIVVDEPTTGLDPEERIRFRNLLSTISNRDVIIILSTHIVSDISSTCRNMALMAEGKVAYCGTPEDLVAQARGKVWQMVVNQEEMDRIGQQFPITTTIPVSDGWDIEVVTDNPSPFVGKQVDANLEHAYVYFMDQHSGSKEFLFIDTEK